MVKETEKELKIKKPRKKRVSKHIKPDTLSQWTDMSAYVCGVRQMNGVLCKAPVIRNGKCAVHKDMSNITHGFYTKALSEEERLEYDIIAVGELDNELRITRIILRRILTKQKNDGSRLQKTKTVEVESENNGDTNTTIKECIDYPTIISKYLTQIGRLEGIKAQIQHMVVAVHDHGVYGFRDRLKQMENMDDYDQSTVDVKTPES